MPTWISQQRTGERRTFFIGFAGGTDEKFETHHARRSHYFAFHALDKDKTVGLFDPNKKKGGFLWFGRRMDRLTAYEALGKLHAGEPIVVQDKRGQHVLANLRDLFLFDRARKK